MTVPPDTGLFPLPLAPFEDYMFADDRLDYPSDFFLRLRFSGIFDRSVFRAAMDVALARHPLLRAWVRRRPMKPLLGGRSRRKSSAWVAADDPRPVIHWTTGAEPPTYANGRHIDLRHEIGLRISLREHADKTDALFQFHHACCDGLGALQFVEDLLATYHDAMCPASKKTPLRPLAPERLRDRGKFGLSPVRYLLRVHKELAGVLAAIRFVRRRPIPLTSGTRVPSRNGSPPQPATICTHTFAVSQTDQLRQAAKRMGCTLNDLLLRDLFVVLDQWVAEHDPINRDGLVRIMIPTNLRTKADAMMPAANVVSMVFLDRRPHKFSSPEALGRSVRRQMNHHKKWRLGLTLIHTVRLFRATHGTVRKLLPVDRCLATAVLSNLGEPTRHTVLPLRNGRIIAGNMTLERLEALPPIRPLTCAAFGVVCYAGRLSVSLNYDPLRLTADDGRELLQSFANRILASLGGQGQPSRNQQLATSSQPACNA